MAFKILVDDGYIVVFETDIAREYIRAYKESGVYRGMKFLPYLGGSSHIVGNY